jgi:trimeric autotransporter adhesin
MLLMGVMLASVLVTPAAGAPGDVTATMIEDAVPGGGINPGAASSGAVFLFSVNGILFFAADDGTNGLELWKSDGGTATMVEDAVPGGGIRPGAAGLLSPPYVTSVNGILIFLTDDGTNGEELWRSEPPYTTAAMVEDAVPGGGINPGAGSSNPLSLANVNGTLFFVADDGTNGSELWRSEPPYTTATMVEDAVPGGGIHPGSGSSGPISFANVNGTLFFVADDGTNGPEVWRSEPPYTTATMVEDAVPGGGINPGSGSSNPTSLGNVNGTLFFVADDGTNGHELWRSEPPYATATMVEDAVPGGGINPGSENSLPQFFASVNGTLVFAADDGTNGFELWKSDGGTATMVEDSIPGGGIGPGSAPSFPNFLASVNDTVFFSADDGTNGLELWKSAPPYATATIVEDPVPGGGIHPGSVPIPLLFTNVNGVLFFVTDDGTNGEELWKTEPPYATATMVNGATGGIRAGAAPSFPNFLTNVNGALFFIANGDAPGIFTSGVELWSSAPPHQTATLIDVHPGAPGGAPNRSNPFEITGMGDFAFFAATGAAGRELWKSDGSTATMVEDAIPGGGINPGSASSSPASLSNVNGTLFFVADDGTNGVELWKATIEGPAPPVAPATPVKKKKCKKKEKGKKGAIAAKKCKKKKKKKGKN